MLGRCQSNPRRFRSAVPVKRTSTSSDVLLRALCESISHFIQMSPMWPELCLTACIISSLMWAPIKVSTVFLVSTLFGKSGKRKNIYVIRVHKYSYHANGYSLSLRVITEINQRLRCPGLLSAFEHFCHIIIQRFDESRLTLTHRVSKQFVGPTAL